MRCLSLPGIECVFHSLDHGPPHFHAIRRGEWECRVFFGVGRTEMLEVKWQKGRMRARHARAVLEAAERHRAELLVEWEESVRP